VQLTNSTTGSSPSDGAYFGVLNGEALFRVYNMENDGIMFFTNHQARLTLGANGNVGIGTTSPSYLAQLHSGTSHSVLQLTNAATGAGPADGTYFAVLNGTNTLRINNQEAGAIDLFTSNTPRVTITPAGSVGVGTLSPQEMFHVTGNARIDGNIAAKYQDVAEWVEAGGALEPGTVVVVDPKRPNAVVQGNRAYDTRVAGAVSPQPGILLGDAGPTRVMVAQSGRVRIKVDARNGPIRIGDLLVTSPRAGYAMRSRPVSVGGVPMHRPGTVLGKALESLDKGTGEILVLLTLQ
jgi:hypothetical protein